MPNAPTYFKTCLLRFGNILQLSLFSNNQVALFFPILEEKEIKNKMKGTTRITKREIIEKAIIISKRYCKKVKLL